MKLIFIAMLTLGLCSGCTIKFIDNASYASGESEAKSDNQGSNTGSEVKDNKADVKATTTP